MPFTPSKGVDMRSGPLTRTDETGFTIIEIIVVIAIIGILAGVAIPSFSTWIPNYRFRSAGQNLYSNFQLAKITAVRRNKNCTVTFSVPESNKYITINGIDYDYVVYVEDFPVNLEYDAGEDIIVRRSWADYDNDVSFDTTKGGGDGLSFTSNDNGLPSISFRPNGMPIDNEGNISSGTVSIKNIKNRTMDINVTAAGSVSIN
jgi:prepilin-type N-terminal cleavage/methylation domain-containing protein